MQKLKDVLDVVRTVAEITLFSLGCWVLWNIYTVYLYEAKPSAIDPRMWVVTK